MATTTKRKNLYIVFGILAIFLLSAIVYAAITGLLTFTGTALLNPGLRVEFVAADFVGDPADAANGESINIIGPDNQELVFTVYLDAETESRTVEFTIQNTGTVDALLGSLVETSNSANPGVTVLWPSSTFYDQTLVPDATLSDEIVVTWDSGFDPSDLPLVTVGGKNYYEVSFTAELDYDQAP